MPRPLEDSQILLWETAAGRRCSLVRRDSPRSFEVTIRHGADILQRVAFDHDTDAADFAIAAMHDGHRVNGLPPAVPKAPTPLSVDLSAGFGRNVEVVTEPSASMALRPTNACG